MKKALLSLCLPLSSIFADTNSGQPADTVFTNGLVYTVDSAQPRAEAVAVTGNTISYVGSNEGAKAFVGPNTQVIDLGGRLMLPGLIDAHTHALVGAVMTRGVDARGETREETLEKLRAYARQAPKEDIIRGFGWLLNVFPEKGPTREELDKIFPDRPAIIMGIDLHNAWVNTKALGKAGITKNSPDLVPGFSYFERDAEGNPTGTIREVPLITFIQNRLHPMDGEYVRACLEEWLPKAARAGLTTVYDAGWPVLPNQSAGYAMLDGLAREGKLPIRVAGSVVIENANEDYVGRMNELRKQYRSDLLWPAAFKLWLDGVVETKTSLLLEPYEVSGEDKKSSAQPNYGMTKFTREELDEIARKSAEADCDLHIHALGDGTCRMALDAIEKARKNTGATSWNPTICHLMLVDDTDIPRFAKLGVNAQFTILWATADSNWRNLGVPLLGKRAYRQYRAKSFFDAGANVTFSSDWPASSYISSFDPFLAMEIGMTRKVPWLPDSEVGPPAEERLTIGELIKGYTLNAARQIRMEDKIGSITKGKLADLVVVDQNLFEIEPSAVHKTKALLTMMDGKITHREGL